MVNCASLRCSRSSGVASKSLVKSARLPFELKYEIIKNVSTENTKRITIIFTSSIYVCVHNLNYQEPAFFSVNKVMEKRTLWMYNPFSQKFVRNNGNETLHGTPGRIVLSIPTRRPSSPRRPSPPRRSSPQRVQKSRSRSRSPKRKSYYVTFPIKTANGTIEFRTRVRKQY